MASAHEHLAKWRHNRQFLNTIQQDCYADWMVTVAFYAAVHCVESLLAKDKISHGMTHEGRNDCLKRNNRYKKIWENFRPLYEASMVARYLCHNGKSCPSFDQWMNVDDIKKLLIAKNLCEIEKSVRKLTN